MCLIVRLKPLNSKMNWKKFHHLPFCRVIDKMNTDFNINIYLLNSMYSIISQKLSPVTLRRVQQQSPNKIETHFPW